MTIILPVFIALVSRLRGNATGSNSMAGLHTCLNCAHDIKDGPFCEQCGQRNLHRRLTFSDMVHDIKEHVLEWDLPWLYTLRESLLRPGRVCRDYVVGKRVRYVNPLKYVLYITSVVLILLEVLPQRYGTSPQLFALSRLDARANSADASLSFAGFFADNPVVLAVLLTPVIALVLRGLYSRSRFNNVELTCFLLYTLGNSLLVAALIHFAMEAFAEYWLVLPTWNNIYIGFMYVKFAVMIVAAVAHALYGAAVFFPERWYYSCCKLLVAILFYFFVFTVTFRTVAMDATADIRFVPPGNASAVLGSYTWVSRGRYLDANTGNSNMSPFGPVNPAEYGEFLLQTGNAALALPLLERSLAAGIANKRTEGHLRAMIAYAHLQLGDPAAALALEDNASEDTALVQLDAALQQQDTDQTLALVDTLVLQGDFNHRLALWLKEANTAAALTEIQQVTGAVDSSQLKLAMAARWAIRFGFTQQAWHLFTLHQYKHLVWQAFWLPYAAAVRQLPEFNRFVRSDGLEAWWRSAGQWPQSCHPLSAEEFECP